MFRTPEDTQRAYERFLKRRNFRKAYQCLENLLHQIPGDEGLLVEIVNLAYFEWRNYKAARPWLIQDLISRYAMKVSVAPVCLVQIETQSPVFWIEIRRRLSTRLFPLTYNPLLKRIDPLPCEACFYPRGGYVLCDEKLHILCGSCFQKCRHCRKEYCPICHTNGCPRCGKRNGMSGSAPPTGKNQE